MSKIKTIAFIGAGNMARAMIIGLLQNGFQAEHMWISSPNIHKHESLNRQQGVHTTTDNTDAARQADVIVLAVKPAQFSAVCKDICAIIQEKNPLIISIVTGVTLQTIGHLLGAPASAVVRSMPNIAATVGASVTGLFANMNVSEKQKTFVESLFRSIGSAIWLDNEAQLDAVTAISGSGPAYLFYVFEAMQKAAEALGLTPEVAKLLVSETGVSAAKMAIETDQSFAQLRSSVTAKGGTTQQAIAVLEQHQLQQVIKMAVDAAYVKAQELSK